MTAPVAISTGEAILAITLVSVPIALLAFALGARGALRDIGKGRFAIEQPPPGSERESASPRAHRDEIRQMVEAKAYRQRARGEPPFDVDAEVAALLDEGEGGDLRADPQLVEEVRQLVVARNERRERQGKPPLDVEAEVERRLRDLEDLGQ